MKKYILALLLSSAFAHADILKLTPGATSKEGVNISASAVATVGGKDFALTTAGAGLRIKKVLFDVKVYIAQLMVEDASRFVRTENGALPSLDTQKQVAIHLTFLRDVPATTVEETFLDALAANNISDKDADIEKFMNTVRSMGDAKNSGSLTIFLAKNADGSESLAYENTGSGKVDTYSLSAGATAKIMSIWLGNPADNGVAALKQELLNGVN